MKDFVEENPMLVHDEQDNGVARTHGGVVPTPYHCPNERVQALKTMHSQETEKNKTRKNTPPTI
jgi:hypothetical protein